MTWVLPLLPVFVVLVAFWLIRELYHFLRCSSCQAAKQAMALRHDDWRIHGAEHRATEIDRDIIAVFYQRPHVVCEPCPYQLVVVDHATFDVQELPSDDDAPYAIRGRK